MPKLKTQHTSKLFYKRFKYKAVVRTPQTSFIRYATRKDIEHLFNSEKIEQWRGPAIHQSLSPYISTTNDWKVDSRRKTWDNRFTLYKLYTWIQTHYDNQKHTIRNEGDKLALFTNDKLIWENFCGAFKNHINELVWPKNEFHDQYLTHNPNNIICKKLPYDKFRYKINIRGKVESQDGFADWIKNYNGDLKASEKLLTGIRRGYYYSDNKFLYSTNSEMMLLLQMFLGNSIKDIQEYITEAELDEQQSTT